MRHRPIDLGVVRELSKSLRVIHAVKHKETDMGFGKGALLWLIGIPLPIILLLALFMNR
ncbi:MAG: Arch protein sorting [Bradyrhizobium sp.]|nr:Arch protein sorting [Bradyrhizobium sp.]